MSNRVQIGTLSYKIKPIDGRLFLNRREIGALCDHDKQLIQYSNGLSTHAAVLAVAEAVAEASRDVALGNRMFPSLPEKANAADGAKYHGPDQSRPL